MNQKIGFIATIISGGFGSYLLLEGVFLISVVLLFIAGVIPFYINLDEGNNCR